MPLSASCVGCGGTGRNDAFFVNRGRAFSCRYGSVHARSKLSTSIQRSCTPSLRMSLFPVIAALLAADPAWEVFIDQGDTFVRAGTKQGLKVGVELTLLGDGGVKV